MKGIVVYDTSYGNTKKIAETIAETLKEFGRPQIWEWWEYLYNEMQKREQKLQKSAA